MLRVALERAAELTPSRSQSRAPRTPRRLCHRHRARPSSPSVQSIVALDTPYARIATILLVRQVSGSARARQLQLLRSLAAPLSQIRCPTRPTPVHYAWMLLRARVVKGRIHLCFSLAVVQAKLENGELLDPLSSRTRGASRVRREPSPKASTPFPARAPLVACTVCKLFTASLSLACPSTSLLASLPFEDAAPEDEEAPLRPVPLHRVWVSPRTRWFHSGHLPHRARPREAAKVRGYRASCRAGDSPAAARSCACAHTRAWDDDHHHHHYHRCRVICADASAQHRFSSAVHEHGDRAQGGLERRQVGLGRRRRLRGSDGYERGRLLTNPANRVRPLLFPLFRVPELTY